VPADRLMAAGLQTLRGHPESRARGGLWAAMLDTKQSWDDLVLRHAPDEETAYRILENRLYDNITARFVQSHDYIAMERLHEIHGSGIYDLIVVDTPPSRNAIDFIEAPRRMAEFFGSRLLKWLTMPYRLGGRRGARMMNVASRPFYQVADRILGSQFLEDIAEFFLNFQSMYGGVRGAGPGGGAAPAGQAHHLRGRLHPGAGTGAGSRVLRVRPGRAAPPPGRPRPQQDAARLFPGRRGRRHGRALCRGPEATAKAVDDLDPPTVSRVLHTVAESFLNFSVVAKREAELRAELAAAPDLVLSVPYFEADVCDLAGLTRMGDHLFAS
jgi:Oxyanion-translocating ATPase